MSAMKALATAIEESYGKPIINKLIEDLESKNTPYSIELVIELVNNNLSYSGIFNPVLYQKYTEYRSLLLQLAAKQDKPLVGHAMHVTTEDGKHYYNARISENMYSDSKEKVCVCMNGCSNIPKARLYDHGLSMSTSGGYFHSTLVSGLTLLPFKVDTRFWFWGGTWCANGGIYITVPMAAWLCESDKDFY